MGHTKETPYEPHSRPTRIRLQSYDRRNLRWYVCGNSASLRHRSLSLQQESLKEPR